MPFSTANICVLALVLLSLLQICHSRPHRSERGLVKDYFVPDTLVFPSDKFEKGADGKYYLKKSAHRSDSEVKYSSPSGDGNNSLEGGDMKSSGEAKTVTDKVQTETANTEPLKEEVTEKVASGVAPTLPVAGEEGKEIKTESIIEESAEKVKIDNKKAPFTPAEPKFAVPPKPDSKDEIPMKTDLPSPIDVEDKIDEKITIGEVPDLYSRLVPIPGTFRVPILIPIREVSYGALKVVPIAPADVSDRLPLPYEDDIVGEGAHESESEVVSQPIKEEEKDVEYRLGNPLAGEFPIHGLSFGSFLKEIKDATNKQNSEKQSKVVDVLGRKFLMQSNVLKYPTGDNGHMFLRFMSVKPLGNPKTPKEIGAKEDRAHKEMEELEKKKEEQFAAKETVKEEETNRESKMKKEEEEILKVEETNLKMNIEQEVPKDIIVLNMGEPEQEMEEAKDVKSVADANEEEETAKKEMAEGAIISEDASERKMDDLLKKEEAKKEMEATSKKDFFLVEKKKKEKSMEEDGSIKPKKKSDKKKKCKCEEKDSDSDEDEDE